MLSDDQRRPLVNKTLNGALPAGIDDQADGRAGASWRRASIPTRRVHCPGGYRLGNRFFRCLGRHGTVNMRRAIAKSCNTYFYAMGHRIGYDAIAPMAKRLGLGQKFDLPVVSQSLRHRPRQRVEGASATTTTSGSIERPDWTASDTLNASIGQGYLIVNPLQLAVMAARIASGRDVQPQLIGAPRQARAAARHPAGASRRRCAAACGKWSTATAPRAPAGCTLPGIEMGGKTGTAQVRKITGGQRGQSGDWKYRDHGLFVFFAPTANPRYAGSVVIEHGLGGARAAAPVAKDVLTYLFDKRKAMDSARRARDRNGAARSPSAPRGARPQIEATAKANARAARMISSAIIPQPLARLPWRLIWLVAGDLRDRPDHALFGGGRIGLALGAQAGA